MAASPEVENDNDGANILLIVIISIICINVLLIYKIVIEARKKTNSSNRSKHMIILFQAVCDILVGLFPLNIRLHGLQDDAAMENTSCWKRILAHTYLFHLMPFIHATGIVLLVAESALFWRRQGRQPGYQPEKNWCSVKNILVSSLPLALGVLAVGPLVLTGFDYKTCSVESYSLSRFQSFYWVSIIVPGFLAVVSACVYRLSSRSSVNVSYRSPEDSKLIILSRDTSRPFIKGFSVQSDANDMKTDLHHAEKISGFSLARYHCSDGKLGCPECGKPFTSYSVQEADDEPLLDHGEHGETLSVSPQTDVPSVIGFEKWNRLAAAVLFCACAMPSTVLDLMYLTAEANGDSSFPETIRVTRGIEALYRLHVLRSLISPLLWVNEYS